MSVIISDQLLLEKLMRADRVQCQDASGRLIGTFVPTMQSETADIDSVSGAESSSVEVCRITPWSYLRSMWTILASSFKTPFTVTAIDLSSGKVHLESEPSRG